MHVPFPAVAICRPKLHIPEAFAVAKSNNPAQSTTRCWKIGHLRAYFALLAQSHAAFVNRLPAPSRMSAHAHSSPLEFPAEALESDDFLLQGRRNRHPAKSDFQAKRRHPGSPWAQAMALSLPCNQAGALRAEPREGLTKGEETGDPIWPSQGTRGAPRQAISA